MSVVIETLVFCDYCNANASGDDRSWPAALIRKRRKKYGGWIQRGSLDFCSAQCWNDYRNEINGKIPQKNGT